MKDETYGKVLIMPTWWFNLLINRLTKCLRVIPVSFFTFFRNWKMLSVLNAFLKIFFQKLNHNANHNLDLKLLKINNIFVFWVLIIRNIQKILITYKNQEFRNTFKNAIRLKNIMRKTFLDVFFHVVEWIKVMNHLNQAVF